MSKKLVKITPMPPLRQSTEQVMSCPKFYVTAVIEDKKMPGNLDSARGTQVHNFHAGYAAWCAQKGVESDEAAFDRFAKGVGPQAAKIIAGMRDGFRVDFAHLFATELPMALDDDMQPTDIVEQIQGIVASSRKPAAFQGTLDTLYLFRPERHIRIDDAKTHPKPFEPSDTLQGKMYSLFVLQHFNWAETVTFRLVFVRYKNLVREVTYRREDIPALIEAVRGARERQRMIHEDVAAGRNIEAISGSHCPYCPLLANRKCPIADFNPEMQLSLTDRVKFALWYAAFSKINNAVLKDHVDATGRKVILKDYNGKHYVYGPIPRVSKVFPVFKKSGDGLEKDHRGIFVMPIIDLLFDHADTYPDDIDWMGNLVISSTKLKSYLGAKKRVILDQAVSDVAVEVSKVKLAVSKPLETVEDEEPDDEELDEEEEGF